MSAAKRLRELLAQPGPILAPGVHDCISAKLVERAGFPAAFISGAAVAASTLGYPDLGLLTMPEILGVSRNIARSVGIPVVADIDTGFGNALSLMRTVREFEAAGLAGVFFEDQSFPPRCGFFDRKEVIPAEEMLAKIEAACSARRSDDFVIIARTDSRAIYGLEHAIERAIAYHEAGADIIYVSTLLSLDEMKRAGEGIRVPLQAVQIEGSRVPLVPAQQLYEMGFKVITHSRTLQRASVTSMSQVLGVLDREGTTASAYPERICDAKEHSSLLRLDRFYQLEEQLNARIAESRESRGEKQAPGLPKGTRVDKTDLPL